MNSFDGHLHQEQAKAFSVDYLLVSSLALVVVVDLLASWCCHHNWLSLHLHGRVDLAKHLVAHHVHHGVDATGELLRHLLLRHDTAWLLHHRHGLQHVHILRVLQVVNQIVQLHLGQTLGLQEVLALVQVETHLGRLLQERLFLLEEVGRDEAVSLRADWPHG